MESEQHGDMCVALDKGVYGPEGIAAGSQCIFKWTMPGARSSADTVDAAQLVSIVSVFYTF